MPSERIEVLLPTAARVVVAEVLTADPVKAAPQGRAMPIGLAPKLPEQKVRLKVTATLRGPAERELDVVKPQGTYVLVPGVRGPFLLDGSTPPRILGRHGADTYSLAAIEAALKG